VTSRAAWAGPPPLEAGTLTAEMERLARRGFTAHFIPAVGGLRVVEHHATVPPEEAVIAEYRRFEGVSDPDDMVIVYAVEARGLRGTLVDAFGVYADPMLADVLGRVAIAARREG